MSKLTNCANDGSENRTCDFWISNKKRSSHKWYKLSFRGEIIQYGINLGAFLSKGAK